MLTETAYVMFHLTKPQFQSREVRCALDPGDRQAGLDQHRVRRVPAPSNGPFTPGQDGYLEDTGLPEYDPDAAAAAIEAWEAENGPLTINYSTTPTGTNKAAADYLQQKWGEVGVDVTQHVIEQSVLITNALLGSPEFEAFGWRNHAGIFVDTQNFWWHGFASDAFGAETADGAVSLNFGRLNDPVINDLLDQVRSETDPAARKELAQEINRQFASECWILPTYQVEWGIHMDPKVQNIGHTPLVDGDGSMLDGAGFPGQVWLTSRVQSTSEQRPSPHALPRPAADPVRPGLHHRDLLGHGGDQDRLDRPRPRPRGRGRQRATDRAGRGGLPVPRRPAARAVRLLAEGRLHR